MVETKGKQKVLEHTDLYTTIIIIDLYIYTNLELRYTFGSELPAGKEKIETNHLNIKVIQCSAMFTFLLIVREYRKFHVHTCVLIKRRLRYHTSNSVLSPLRWARSTKHEKGNNQRCKGHTAPACADLIQEKVFEQSGEQIDRL